MSFTNHISIPKLASYSAVGGVICVVATLIGRRSLKANYEQQPFVREPIKLLRQHQAANYILGQGFHVAVSFFMGTALKFVNYI